MSRIRSRRLKRRGRPLPQFRLKSVIGVLVLLLIAGAIIFKSFVGEFLRVRGHAMAPSIVAGDVILVSYTPAEPGETVLIESGDTRVLRRLLGNSGDIISVGSLGKIRNGRRLVTQGIKWFWRDGPKPPSRQTAKPRSGKKRAKKSVDITPVPEGHVHVVCEHPRHCRNAELVGLIKASLLSGRVVAQWPDRSRESVEPSPTDSDADKN